MMVDTGLLPTEALFGLPHIRLVQLPFSAGTVFFSHNNLAGTVFSASFSQVSDQRTGQKNNIQRHGRPTITSISNNHDEKLATAKLNENQR